MLVYDWKVWMPPDIYEWVPTVMQGELFAGDRRVDSEQVMCYIDRVGSVSALETGAGTASKIDRIPSIGGSSG